MRRNDFFKYLLLGGGGSASRAELETENLPYTFNSNSYKLRNYRIYGNTVDGESVGDLVTEGEHSGEYCVPVKVEGKNLFDEVYPNISSNTKYKAVYVGDGVFTLSTNIGVYSGTTNLFLLAGNVSTGADSNINGVHSNHHRTVNAVDGYVTIGYRSRGDIDPRNGSTILNSGSTALPYEPYQPPVTTNLYLPEQIKMVGDEAEYIDFREQKQHFADGTSTDVTIPPLPILSGTNTLSVGTEVQPSKVYLQGKISEPETVSSQSLQMNMQSLQPLSLDDEDLELDVMPTDNSLQPDVMPIEKPVLNLNDVSEIENAEIERGVESAE